MDQVCPGRAFFAKRVPFGSPQNQCPFGASQACRACEFYVGSEIPGPSQL